jgi:hypothetical protein
MRRAQARQRLGLHLVGGVSVGGGLRGARDRVHDPARAQVTAADEVTQNGLCSARVTGSYRPDDLAVLRAEDTTGLKPARLGGEASQGR